MGFYNVMGSCARCGKLFCFHPNKVPSFKGNPICKDCLDRINDARIKQGLPPIPILKDAYKGVLDEDEDAINWGD